MSCQRALFFLTCFGCFCFGERSITVSPREITKHIGDAAVLRCTYPVGIKVRWFFRFDQNNPNSVDPANPDACLKQRKSVRGNHTIYSESDEVCVLEAINLKRNITYICFESPSLDKRDNAVVVVLQKSSTKDRSREGTEHTSTWTDILVIILVILIVLSICIGAGRGIYCYIKKQRSNQTIPEVPLMTIDTNNSASAVSKNATITGSPVTVDNNSTNTASDAPNSVESLHQIPVKISAEERKNIKFLIEDFLSFEFFESADKISIQTGNLMEVLQELAHDVLVRISTKGAYEILDIKYYIERLKEKEISNVDEDVEKLVSDRESIIENRRRHMISYCYRRTHKIDTERNLELRTCPQGVQNLINKKYKEMELITDFLKYLSDNVLKEMSANENEAWNIKQNGLGCQYHRSCYVIQKIKYFKELICNQWYDWHLQFYYGAKAATSEDNEITFANFKNMKNDCLESIEGIAVEKIKVINSASCTCYNADLEAVSKMNGAIQLQKSGARPTKDYEKPLFKLTNPDSTVSIVNGLPFDEYDGGASTAMLDPETNTSDNKEVDLKQVKRFENDSGISIQSTTNTKVGQLSKSSEALHDCEPCVLVCDRNAGWTISSEAEYSKKPEKGKTDDGIDAESESEDKLDLDFNLIKID